MNLIELGWSDHFQQHFQTFHSKGFVPARIAREHKGIYIVYAVEGEFKAQVSGRFRYKTKNYGDFPAVGDWVAIRIDLQGHKATIHEVLPRKSKFSRPAVLAGRTEEQVLASNIDTVFIVSGLDGDFNFRRIERYIAVVWKSGAEPVILLNKSDLCSDGDLRIKNLKSIASGIPVFQISALKQNGLEELNQYLKPGVTAVFIGSSGVGKTTIINHFIDFKQLKTGAVREYDGKGRHTTTYKELIHLPSGGIVIDTPGMRGISLWSDTGEIAGIFSDIKELAENCKFNDCHHTNEPGCALQDALEKGELDNGRFNNYIKLQKETKNLQRKKREKTLLREPKDRKKQISKIHKEMQKNARKRYK